MKWLKWVKWVAVGFRCSRFGLVQIFCAGPKIYLPIVAVTNILHQTKRWFALSKIGFCACTKSLGEALNAVKFLGWLKKFGPAQDILGLVQGQGIRTNVPKNWVKKTKIYMHKIFQKTTFWLLKIYPLHHISIIKIEEKTNHKSFWIWIGQTKKLT